MEIKRWTAKRKSPLVIEILQDKTTVSNFHSHVAPRLPQHHLAGNWPTGIDSKSSSEKNPTEVLSVEEKIHFPQSLATV